MRVAFLSLCAAVLTLSGLSWTLYSALATVSDEAHTQDVTIRRDQGVIHDLEEDGQCPTK